MKSFLGMGAAAILAVGSVAVSGCKVNPYCITCQSFDAGPLDATVPSDGGKLDSPPADACISTGMEVCNGVDDDCDGLVDELPLPMVGQTCGSSVGQCHAGTWMCTMGRLNCGGGNVAPVAEVCNGLDDNCDGMVDDGDPGGGELCGSDIGACRRGTTMCTGGHVMCIGGQGSTDEVCNGIDDDCDGQIDDGNPGGGALCMAGATACTSGFLRCSGGMLRCMASSGPMVETCNGIDDDCDGMTDEDFDLTSDANHCGSCSTQCRGDHARTRCAMSMCQIANCDIGFYDSDGDYTNGCEYACDFRGAEVCNGVDDDCDHSIDEGLTPPDICLAGGECHGTVATCGHVAGWQCMYGPTVSVGPAGDVTPESNCDGLDNDCNGMIDDAFPMKGQACTRGTGACQTTGIQVCNATSDGLSCNAATPGAGGPEVCNGIDDDCNGTLDDGAPDSWVTITGAFGSTDIYQYEASRPDATDTETGAMSHRSCSAANRLPWVNATYPQAVAACAAAGGRLCTETEWQRACETPSACTWSYASTCTTYQPNTCNGNDFDSDAARPGDQDQIFPTGHFASCYSDWGGAGHVFDLSGNVKEWTTARSMGINPERGGSYNNTALGISCDFSFVVADDTFLFNNVGFRCCR